VSAKARRSGGSGGSDPRFTSSSVPLYYQLATLLRQKIVTGEYEPDQRIASEAELSADYGVSRMTVRQALANLEEEGLIRREAGRGTFVNDRPPVFSGDLELDRSIDDLISMGLATSVQLLELKEVKATDQEASDLEVPPDSPIIRCKRLRFFRDEPYCYIVNHVPREIGRRIDEGHWRHGSVLKYIEEELDVPLRIAKQRLRATLADAGLARWLQVRVGDPLLLVDYHIRTDENRPVEMAELYYRSDIYSFTLRLTRSGRDQEEVWSLKEHRFEH
jgi:GntR family transcriptional regulator